MISMYTGSVGSGKSYHALELGLRVIKERKHGMPRKVIANFPIIQKKRFFATKRRKEKDAEIFDNWIYIDEITPDFLMAQSIINGWYGKESCCTVIIDEAGILFNSRDWQGDKGVRNKWNKFLALSRKFGYDLILVTQADRMIDRQIRSMAEYDVKHLKANNSFLMSWLSLFKITLFMYSYQWYQTKLKGNLRVALYRNSIGARYDTMRIFSFEELIGAVKALYDGKIIPAPVAAQISTWEKERIDRALELAEQQAAEAPEEVSPLDGLDFPSGGDVDHVRGVS